MTRYTPREWPIFFHKSKLCSMCLTAMGDADGNSRPCRWHSSQRTYLAVWKPSLAGFLSGVCLTDWALTLIVNIISLSHRHRRWRRLGCRWVDTCASSSDASPLYIHDRSNVVQWKGSSLPSSQCTSSDQCIFGKMCSDESRTEIFHRDTRIRMTIGPGPVC